MKSHRWKIQYAAGFGAGVLLTALVKFPPNSSSDWAAWVQAIGSIGAIGIAIWVSHKQYRDALILEQERKKSLAEQGSAEIRAIVEAVRDELDALWEGYNLQIGPLLRSLPVGSPFNFIYPVFTDAFTVYNGVSSKIGRIPERELRRLIVATYAHAKGLVYSFQLNNKMLTDRQQIDLLYQGNDRGQRLAQQDQILIEYAAILKERDTQIQTLVVELSVRIDSWLSSE
ncbi:hypothetical protein [Paraburkholderia caffeinilytica]|uniref:hypothetical protein n=1 Tax=Paraburkholderia caffeinilytica TaxID=1761016 RepID=UPI0038BD6E6C